MVVFCVFAPVDSLVCEYKIRQWKNNGYDITGVSGYLHHISSSDIPEIKVSVLRSQVNFELSAFFL